MEIKYFGGYYRHLPEWVVYNALIKDITDNKLPEVIMNLFLEAWGSSFWVEYGYNGKSFISDKYEPRIGSFIHDYMSRTGRGGKISDSIFYYLERKTGTGLIKGTLQYSGVRIGSQFFNLRDRITRRKKEPTENMIKVYRYIKNIK
jgi:hypothetical protein